VLNNFGNGRVIHITVRKGSKLEDFSWSEERQDRENEQEGKKNNLNQK
jgi:hypothetical protein